jgi:hypothetical protein
VPAHSPSLIFSKNEDLRKKILVVNDADLQGQDSFIRRGPVHLIDTHSKFNKEIQLEYNDNANFGLVKERLEKRVVGKKEKDSILPLMRSSLFVIKFLRYLKLFVFLRR